MNEKNNRLNHFPIAFFPIVMGLSGLALAWRKASELLAFGAYLSNLIGLLAASVFVLVSFIYLIKILKHRDAVRVELTHPVKSNFFPAVSISIVLLAALALPFSRTLASALFAVGAVLHLALTFWVFSRWIFSNHYQNPHISPAWFIPVVGNILMPVISVSLGMEEIGWFFFSIGIVFWLVLLTIFIHRIFFFEPMPAMLTPTLFILIAPPAVGFISYLSLNGYVDNFAQVLYGFGLFITLFLLSEFKRFLSLPFFLSWWAYSFPLAAMTIASFLYYEQTRYLPVRLIAIGLLALTSVLVLNLLFRTLTAIIKKGICIPEG